MKKILISALLISIVACQKKSEDKTSQEVKVENITKSKNINQNIEEEEKRANDEKIAEFKSESKLKGLSEKNFNFIINKLLEDKFGLTKYNYLDFDKIDSDFWNSEISTPPINKMDQRVTNKNLFVFEFNYGTNSSLRQKYFLLENNEMKNIDFKLNETDNQKLNLLLEKIGGKGSFLLTDRLKAITKDNQNNYELTFGLQKSSDSYSNPSISIKYKTTDFKSIVPNSIMKFNDEKGKFVELK
ncbi:hypothetical protein B0A81_03980 [Flavobacterium plurextorum]|uniref:Lipoprotein n=1 Tax=Flavobacterium plurextorum TaxID=1114867 RepID=A0ABX4CZE2_9FLAO|nr:hypothetical protein [Flavobacterium plurextorum]OXB10180.1 hypothetical protein B0A81_03980 [Flavobacterium plurextorum]